MRPQQELEQMVSQRLSFEKEANALTDPELHRLIGAWNRERIQKMKKMDLEISHEMKTAKVFEFVKKILNKQELSEKELGENYYTAEAFLDWYNSERVKTFEKQKQAAA